MYKTCNISETAQDMTKVIIRCPTKVGHKLSIATNNPLGRSNFIDAVNAAKLTKCVCDIEVSLSSRS